MSFVDTFRSVMARRVSPTELSRLIPALPVGSVYISVVSTNPATLLGYGTWSAIAAGRVLVGIDSGDADFDTVEETGGAKTKAISAHAGAAVAAHSSHTHQVTAAGTVAWPAGVPTFTGDPVAAASTNATPDLVAADVTGTGVSPVTTATGTIAWPAEVPAFTGSPVASGNESASLTHDVTQPNDHAALNVVQPFYVVHMWRRTA